MICNVPVCDSDIDEPIVIVPTSNTLGKEYVGTSETDKPTNVQQYSIYHELDTGKNYYYDNGQWSEIPCCSGGGGDYNSLTMTVIGDDGSLYVYGIPSGDYYSCVFETEYGFSTSAFADDGEEKVITVLYNGGSVVLDVPPTVTEVSGNATYDSETNRLTATGDFTIKGRYSD